jgi:membrane associated rhomboid family serine protease
MIPLRDVIPSRTAPYITISVIAANALVFGFLNPSLLHVGSNMLCLWLFGGTVEDRMGHVRFLTFYLLCSGATALAQTMAAPSSPMAAAGASGAVAAVMGAYLVLYPYSRIVTFLPIVTFFHVAEVPAVVFVVLWVLLQFAGAPASIAGFTAHVTGFIAGGAGVLVFRRPERLRVEWWNDV